MVPDQQRQHIDLEHLAPLVGVAVEDPAEVRHPGVVDEDVEVAVGVERGRDELVDRARLTDVADHDGGATSAVVDQRGALLHRVGGSARQDHVGAGRAHPLGDRAADAARCAGDDGGLAGQVGGDTHGDSSGMRTNGAVTMPHIA